MPAETDAASFAAAGLMFADAVDEVEGAEQGRGVKTPPS